MGFISGRPDGKVVVSTGGRFDEFEEDNGASFAVTGGTGPYEDATGQMTIVENQELCDRKGANITLDLALNQ